MTVLQPRFDPAWRRRVLAWVFVGSFLVWTTASLAAEFRAQAVTRSALGEVTGTVFFQGENIRQELNLKGVPAVAILRGGEQRLWVLLPQNRTYLELPFTQEGMPGLLTLPRQGQDMRLLGQETVNGYLCDKYAGNVTVLGRTLPRTVWVARDLHVPIKMVSADGSLAAEFTHIRPEKLDPALFLLPAGYARLALPGLAGPDGGGGRKRQPR